MASGGWWLAGSERPPAAKRRHELAAGASPQRGTNVVPPSREAASCNSCGREPTEGSLAQRREDAKRVWWVASGEWREAVSREAATHNSCGREPTEGASPQKKASAHRRFSFIPHPPPQVARRLGGSAREETEPARPRRVST